jgi:anion-transporting  ArsA/GET3 family ATPase
VGKTTMVAAIAQMAADADLSVLIVELEGKPGIAAAFGSPGPLPYEDIPLSGTGDSDGQVRGRTITPDDALVEYLGDHGLQRVTKRLRSSGILDVVATAIPGIRDVLVLGKVKRLERDGVADLIVVDAPATGHAITLLTSAGGLLGVARGGPVRTQATEVSEMLSDPERARVALVTLPEEMPVSEAIEAAYVLEDRAGVQLGPVIVNGVISTDPALDAPATDAAAATGADCTPGQLRALERARQFQLARAGVQSEQLARLGRELPLPQLQVPALPVSAIGPAELRVLSAALADGVGALAPEEPPA